MIVKNRISGRSARPNHLDLVEKLSESVRKHPTRRPALCVPNFELSTRCRNEAALYCAPNAFAWDPSVCGMRIVCSGGDHPMNKNGWRDVLCFDFGAPVYLRRRMMRCQHSGCPMLNKCYVVRGEGVQWYPFVHTEKRVFTKKLHDWIIVACTNGTPISQVC